MVNTILSLVIAAWTIALAILGERKNTCVFARRANAATALVGFVSVVVSVIATAVLLAKTEGEEMIEWTTSVVKLFASAILPVFVLLFAVCTITSLMSRRNERLRGGVPHKLRVIMIAVSSIFIAITAYFAYVAGVTDSVTHCLVAGGAGLSCVMRACALIENGGKRE